MLLRALLFCCYSHFFFVAHIYRGSYIQRKTKNIRCGLRSGVWAREMSGWEKFSLTRDIVRKTIVADHRREQRQSRAAGANEEKTAERSWIFSRFTLWFCCSLLHPYKNSLANVTHRAHQDSWVFQRFSLSPSPRKKFLWMKSLLELRRGCEKSWGYHGMF